MSCSVCKEIAINCDNCGDLLKTDFFCFKDEQGRHHFCDGMCFDIWIVEENKNQLEDAHHKEKE